VRGHTGPLSGIQFNHDASRLITASMDGTARLWSGNGDALATFRDIPRRFSGIGGRSVVAKFSPDGKLVVTAHVDHSLRLWQAVDGSPVATLEEHTANVTDAVFSSDSRLLVTSSDDGSARIWRINPSSLVSAVRELRPAEARGKRQAVKALAFSPDDVVVTADADALRLWDAAEGTEIATLRVDTSIEGLAISRDGRRLAAIHTSSVSLWEAMSARFTRWRTRMVLERIDPADERTVRVVSAKADNISGTDRQRWEPPVAVAPNGRTVAAVAGRTVVLWSAETGMTVATIAAHARAVSHVSFDPTGEQLLTTSYDGSAKIWNTRTGSQVATLSGHEGPVVFGIYSPSGARIATVSDDHTARLWNSDGSPLVMLRGHDAAVRSLAFSENEQRLITASADGTARVWEVASGTLLATLGGPDAPVGVVALDATGDRAATGGLTDNYGLRLWNVAAGSELHRFAEQRGTVMGLAFNRNGQSLLAWSADGWARLWDTRSPFGRVAFVGYGCLAPVSFRDVYLSADDARIVTILKDGRTDVWDSRTGSRLLALHTFRSTSDGPPCEINPNLSEVTATAASPDLRSVLVAGDNGALVLFAIPSREEVIQRARELVPRELTKEERAQFFLPD
jgi:WD40 repeat protein